jgi:hypothetical protein
MVYSVPRTWRLITALCAAFCFSVVGRAVAQDSIDSTVGQTYVPPFVVGNDVSALPFDRTYYAQIHNTYEHSDNLVNWLNAGYRTVELDVIDREDWEDDPNGPYVAHNLDPVQVNCKPSGNSRLADCLKIIVGFIQANHPIVPIVVLVDMKASWDPGNAWKADEVAQLDRWISKYLGTNMYRYTDLKSYLASTSLGQGGDTRTLLKNSGWPQNVSLSSKLIVGLTGGMLGYVNQNMSSAMNQLSYDSSTFMCPDVDAGDPDEISGRIDGMDDASSANFVCANLKAGDHMETTLNRSSDYRQIIHVYGASGDFSNTDYAYNYISVAQGASLVGWDTSIDETSSDTWTPDWQSSIPLVGQRRGVPGYFEMLNLASNQCVDVYGADYGYGTEIRDYTCNNGDNQKWVYTAEGQLRPKGNNAYCLDIQGGYAGNGKDIHLWNCDGGRSEKWFIDQSGLFHSRDNTDQCLDLRKAVEFNDYISYRCSNSKENQQFKLRAVADWLPGDY